MKMKMKEVPIEKKQVIFSLATSFWFILIGLGLLLFKLNPIALGIALLIVGVPVFIVCVNLYE